MSLDGLVSFSSGETTSKGTRIEFFQITSWQNMNSAKQNRKAVRFLESVGCELPEPRMASISLAFGEALPPKRASK
jgi:hypothetical protein